MQAPTIHFLHISKTGGTAIKEVLRAHADDLRLILHQHGTTLQNIPYSENVFFFLREPTERFISGFLSRQRQGGPRYFYPWSNAERAAYQHFSTPNDLAEALSASRESKELAQHAMLSIRHLARPLTLWLQSEQYLTSRLADILFIGLQEKLEADFVHLKEKLGLPANLELPQDDVSAHRAPPGSNRQLSELGRSNIQRWYAEDQKLYDYCCSIRDSINLRSHR